MTKKLVDWKKHKVLAVLLDEADYALLMGLKGDQTWHKFLRNVNSALNPPIPYAERRWRELLAQNDLTDDDVCQSCKVGSYYPQKLEKINFADLIYATLYAFLHQRGISKEVIVQRFAEHNIEPVALGCPACQAYEGTTPIGHIINKLVPELHKAAMLAEIKQHKAAIGFPSE